MGGGSYSFSASTARTNSYVSKSREEIFTKKTITNLMDPKNTLRECCDSEEHPNTIPIIVALDVTGSMGNVPEGFVRDEMSKMMSGFYEAGLRDNQVLFLGIGDHECDSAPLQVGQFEADDQLLDKWLKDIYLEGGGGGNAGESYLLAWYYGARHTTLESLINRGQKGFLFTIGDEPTLEDLPASAQRKIFGDNGEYSNVTAEELLKEASEKYNVYHFHLTETYSGSRKQVQTGWKERLHDNCIILDSYKEIAGEISRLVKESSSTVNSQVIKEAPSVVKEDTGNTEAPEMML